VKIPDQNTQGVRRSKSQTESELVFRKQNVLAFLPRILFLWFVYGCASLPGCKKHMKVLVWIFFSAIRTQNKNAESRAKFHKFWLKIAMVCTKFLKKSSETVFFPEIPRKNLHWIRDKTRQISGQTDREWTKLVFRK